VKCCRGEKYKFGVVVNYGEVMESKDHCWGCALTKPNTIVE
jgi:hypothetical protein